MLAKLQQYARLVRLHKPIGILLFLWPTLWALWIAGDGHPPGKIVLIFIAGVLLMRSAGCAINDFADRNIDPHVSRTAERPLAAQKITPTEAITIFLLLLSGAFALVLLLNGLTILIAACCALFTIVYPFSKRVTYLPQLLLGIAFSCSVPMAFAAIHQQLPNITWLIFAISVLWSIMYDTQYAMVDRDDDQRIGVKSLAILLGKYDRIALLLLQLTMLLLLGVLGFKLQFRYLYFVALLLVAGLFTYQQYLTRTRAPQACFHAFLNNNWVGLIIFNGIMADYLFAT